MAILTPILQANGLMKTKMILLLLLLNVEWGSLSVFQIALPVIWISKLQNKIALLTMESEYIALSYAMQRILPFKTAVFAVSKVIALSNERSTCSKLLWGRTMLVH